MFQLFKRDLAIVRVVGAEKTFGCDIFYAHYKPTFLLLYMN